ncbi:MULTISPECIES: CBM35 domain-containing protein [Streptomyces]|uniref:Putative dimeric protein n=2 Tax=Actinomycetes TaxID=1760 RepID=F2RGZ3_STRVP|nr:CBM35 domain-containing protein [Streptomyces venezuelae]APE23049.1 carbohydrate-binding protein [Streptomyces venezuelae]QES00430.1 carbohydrate-binding protein [Streptomyces venezuelae ATCC 10712]QES07510.1 carbohydrate-binding protein [Streptomyces venezuelae]QES13811.1 carbohydrate-binding protein [Streptomyces venezuelae]CCA57321.1 putative dimeric protein [Streptomyces venezuelae ATCC 10712]
MAAGNDGANKPENDDPFGYLYEDGQAAGAQPPQGGGYGYPGPAPAQPGVPRTSYNQVRTVGERQYGGHANQQHAQPYVPPQQQVPYGQPTAQYAAPETYGGPPTRQGPPPQHHHGGGSGRGPNTRGLLIGAVAVVAVVVVGIAAAVITNKGDDDKDKQAGGTTSTAPVKPSEQPSSEPSSEETPAELPKQNAATLKLGGTAMLAKDVKGAEGADGTYVGGFNQVGSSVTWKAQMPTEGKYRLTVRYAIPAVDANATLTVNGKPNTQPIGLKNFIHSSDPNLEKNWQTTWAPVDLKKGENEIKISCETGNQCDVLLDWLEVTQAQ